MSQEKGSLKDWDDRHYQSIDDLPPEAWDAARDGFAPAYAKIAKVEYLTKRQQQDRDFLRREFVKHSGANHKTATRFVKLIIDAGFKRD